MPFSDPPPGDPGGPPAPRRRPGPGARVVSRPRLVAVVGWVAIVAIGVGMLQRGLADDDVAFAVFGASWTLLLGAGLLSILWIRVTVDGDLLHVRGPFGWRGPVDLSRLAVARYGYEHNGGRSVHLIDADGHAVRLDAVNHRLVPLYRELAARVGPWDAALQGALADTVGRYR
jgi:hypothetical protein